MFVALGMLPIGAISVGIWMTRPTTGIVVFGAGTLGVMLASLLVGQTVRGITKTALYHYATETEVPPGFEGFDFETLEGRTETPS